MKNVDAAKDYLKKIFWEMWEVIGKSLVSKFKT